MTTLLEGFTRTEIKTSGARIVTVHGGSGSPLLLMHGNPFTHLNWHRIAPRLAQEFTVVATDLRAFSVFLTDRLMQVPGVSRLRSMICLEEIKPASPLPLPPAS